MGFTLAAQCAPDRKAMLGIYVRRFQKAVLVCHNSHEMATAAVTLKLNAGNKVRVKDASPQSWSHPSAVMGHADHRITIFAGTLVTPTMRQGRGAFDPRTL